MQQPIWSIVALVVFAALFVACAEARNPGSGGAGAGGDSTSSSDGGGDSTGGAGAGGGGPGGGGASAGGADASAIVFNEIGATGDDFVELTHVGQAAFDLSGFAVADSDASGDPKLDEAMRFPDGTLIAPGDHLVIAGQKDTTDGVGPHTDCFPDGPASCFYAAWGISASAGEKLFLLSPDDEVVADVEYPADAAPDGETWGRLPDGTGDFTETAPTAGASNAVP